MKYIEVNGNLVKIESIMIVSPIKYNNDVINGMQHTPAQYHFEIYLSTGHMLNVSDKDETKLAMARFVVEQQINADHISGIVGIAKPWDHIDYKKIFNKTVDYIREHTGSVDTSTDIKNELYHIEAYMISLEKIKG